ncbi:hypothetical protein DV735_g1272, partial [Chaetothyriales sp. CBS 134920]
MANATHPSAAPNNSHLLTTQRALLDTLTSFLTVCTHHILFLRNLYPARSFLATRAYNYPVRQSRHPAVCGWINDAIAAIRSQLAKSTVDKVQLCIYETEQNRVLERWTFDVHALAAVSPRDQDMPFDEEDDANSSNNTPVNVADLEAVFRATLSRITATSARLRPLPLPSSEPSSSNGGSKAPDCSFTLSIELRSAADRPVGRLDKLERAWIVAEPDSFEQPPSQQEVDGHRGGREWGATTTPVRRLEAGELRMEVWVEESAAKFAYAIPQPASDRAAAGGAREMNYGEGMTGYGARFDLENGYEDVRGTDINRKPDTGRGPM